MEALNERLPRSHPQKEFIESKSRNLRAGFIGEKSLEFTFSFLPDEKYLIFHNLRFKDPQGYFQIDILLVTNSFILIIDAKNIHSEVIFDDMGQTIRRKNDQEEIFKNPVQQVNLQHLRFLRWLRKYNFHSIPIEKAVVYTNNTTILKNHTNQKELPNIVMHKDRLLEKIEELEDLYRTVHLKESALSELTYQLCASHIPNQLNTLDKYNLSARELIKGVICSSCLRAPMLRKGGKWCCDYCDATSKVAHKRALEHYGLLINEYINNREAREFLQVESRYIAKQLLQKEQLEKFGVTSGMKYKLDIQYLLK
jgi:hypothetical protein